MRFYHKGEKAGLSFSQPKRKWLFFLGGFIFLVVLAGTVYFIKSPFFKIKEVKVEGLPEYESQKLIADLEIFFTANSRISSLFGPDNILAWHGNTEKFLEENPNLETLKIEKNYFDKEIKIFVVEKRKFGLWCDQTKNTTIETAPPGNSSSTVMDDNVFSEAENKKCYWFDENGVLFKETAFIESEIFNRVNDYSERDLKAGNKILDPRLFTNLKIIFFILEKEGLNAKTVNLKDLSTEEIYVESVSDPKIFFSLRQDPSYALSAIDALKKDGRWQKILYVDFRIENKAYYKFK